MTLERLSGFGDFYASAGQNEDQSPVGRPELGPFLPGRPMLRLPELIASSARSAHYAERCPYEGERNGRERLVDRPWPARPEVRCSRLSAAARQWVAHGSRMGAAWPISASIGPLILIAVAIAGRSSAARPGQKRRRPCRTCSRERHQRHVAGADRPAQGIVATIVGRDVLFAAIGVVVQLKDAFNTVWEVDPEKQGGVWGFVRTYIMSLAGVLAVGFLLLVSMLLTAVLAAFGKYIGTFVPESIIQIAGFLVSFSVIALLFAMMFKWPLTRRCVGPLGRCRPDGEQFGSESS